MSGVEFTAAMSVVISAILLLLLCCLYFGYRADNLRDHLFTLRDEMFLYALDHGIAETPAHENLRLMMNSLIRYAHRVSLARLMLLEISRRVFKLKPGLPATYIEWVEAVKALPPDEAERLREFHAKAMLLIMTHMITGSPLLWPAFPLVALHDVISKSTRAFIDGTVSAVSRRVPSVDLFEVDALSRPSRGRSGLFSAG
jgi:hypothetical protein